MMTDAEDLWTGEWLNPPERVSVGPDGALTATTRDRTDFWQATWYGFRRDDGHALLRSVPEEFSATLTFRGGYRTLYDQAGLMLRAGSRDWVKFGVEWTDGRAHLSVVGTRDGLSDWSAVPIELDGALTLRATRVKDALLLQRREGGDWRMVRLLPAPRGKVRVGPYLCSPERAGFEARFETFAVTDPEVRTLHA